MIGYNSRISSHVAQINGGSKTIGEALSEYLDRGKRLKTVQGKPNKSKKRSTAGEYRVRSPTRSERLNRALKELRPAAFKVHMLIWTWRGAPARGTLPFFTIRSLEKFCSLTRPTLRKAITELVVKGWIEKLKYNVHHKNTLYKLIRIRDVQAPRSSGRQDEIQEERRGCRGTSAGGPGNLAPP